MYDCFFMSYLHELRTTAEDISVSICFANVCVLCVLNKDMYTLSNILSVPLLE